MTAILPTHKKNADNEKQNADNGEYEEKWGHIKRQYLILAESEFVVVIDLDGDIDWQTSQEWDLNGPKDPVKYNAVLNNVALLEAIPFNELSPEIKLHYKRLIGESLARGLAHDYIGAKYMAAAAGRYIQDRSEEISRKWYLSASALMAAVCLIFGGIVWTFREAFFERFGSNATWLILASTAGAGGALLSVIVRSGKLQIDCAAGRKLHYLEGASRIWAGALSGFLAGLALRSGIVLATLMHSGNLDLTMLLVAFSAGAGERFATSVISKFNMEETAAANASLGHASMENQKN